MSKRQNICDTVALLVDVQDKEAVTQESDGYDRLTEFVSARLRDCDRDRERKSNDVGYIGVSIGVNI